MSEPLANILLSEEAITKDHIIISKEKCDNAKIKGKTIIVSRFIDIGFKESEFEDCVFNHSYFERCYFRKAKFTEVSLIGCQFRDCRFDGAEFSGCHLDRAEFHDCSVTYEQLRPCLPAQENVLWELARNLRVNAQDRGQTEDYRKYLLEEIRASEKYNFKKAFGWNDPYYRKKYPRLEDRLNGLWTWLDLKLEGFFWGHGEVPSRVIVSGAIIVLFFALLFYGLKIQVRNMSPEASFLGYLWLSAATFVAGSYGDLVPASFEARLLVTAERALGLIIFGFLVAALYRRISKR